MRYLCSAFLLSLLLSCAPSDHAPSFSEAERRILSARHWGPPTPADPTNRWAQDRNAAQLGEALFFDQRLSANGLVSCATCHDPNLGFSDGLPFSIGIGETRRHSPHLYNVGFQRWFYWDGRRDTLWGQALVPLEKDAEMGSDRVSILRFIADDDQYRSQFEALFGPLPSTLLASIDGPAKPMPKNELDPRHLRWSALPMATQFQINEAFSKVGKAIAAFEMTIITGSTPFDTFVEGLETDDPKKQAALSLSAQRGLKLFMNDAGCHLCHTGPLFSDREFHYLGFDGIDLGRSEGVPEAQNSIFSSMGAFSDETNGEKAAYLSAIVAGHPTDGAMKTPSLRNIALSPPYMHDGRFATLHDVVTFYNDMPPAPDLADREFFLVPLGLDDQGIDDIVAFLHSLTDSPTLPEQ